MANNTVEIVFRPLEDPKLGSMMRSSQISSSKPTTTQAVQQQSSQPSKPGKGKQKIVHPPLLTHWAVKVTLEIPSLGYDAGDYYYGLVTEDAAPKLCVIDTTIWDSLGDSSTRLRGLTSEIPPELFVKASTLIQRTPPYDLMSNNCQDFAIMFFLQTCERIYKLEETLKTLQHGHHGFNPLIKYTKDTKTGWYTVYNRAGKLLTRFEPRVDVDVLAAFMGVKKSDTASSGAQTQSGTAGDRQQKQQQQQQQQQAPEGHGLKKVLPLRTAGGSDGSKKPSSSVQTKSSPAQSSTAVKKASVQTTTQTAGTVKKQAQSSVVKKKKDTQEQTQAGQS